MKLRSIKIEKFRSFMAEQTFHFPEGPGLYFLTGDNQAEPRLGANGAGKSTVWDALCWALYGKTLRGLSAGDVSNWGSDGKAKVTLEYEADGVTYFVTRSRGPISWTLLEEGADKPVDLVADETNPVLSQLRLNFLAASHSVFMAQQQPMFLDLNTTTKAALVSEALDLDSWLRLSEAARAKHKIQLDKAIHFESKVAAQEAALETLRAYDWKEEAQRWESKRAQDLVSLGAEMQETVAKVYALPKAVVSREAGAPSSKDLEDKLQQMHDDRIEVCVVPEQLLAAEIKRLRKQLDEHEKSGGLCPTCKQPLPRSKQLSGADEIKRQLEKAEKELEEVREIDAVVSKAISKFQSKVTEARNKEKAAEWAVRDRARNLETLERKIEELEDKIRKTQKETNPFAEKIKQAKEHEEQLLDEIENLKDELEAVRFTARSYEYWVTGFKEIRLHLISEALNQLEIEVNSSLQELGLEGWGLHFDVERETKSGTQQIGFHVKVVSPTNEKPVPWESWSGGESQRLRIAATMGMANLIRSATGATMNLEVWDEPTQHLSGQGVEDLLECLRNRAVNEGRQIWIVDHRSLGFGQFDGVTTITKGVEGSVIGAGAR